MNAKLKIFFFALLFTLRLTHAAQEKAVSKFYYYQGLIFLDVYTNQGDTLLALFDTGAEISAIDSETSDQLKLSTIDSTEVTGSNTTMIVEVVQLNGLNLEGHFVESISPTKRDLSHSLSPKNRKLDIILGYDFFENSMVKIDFQNQELYIMEKGLQTDLDYYVPFYLDHNIPRFSGMVNGKIKMDFRLDTGASLFETEDVYINITTNDWNNIKEKDTTLTPEFHLSATGINNEVISLPVVRLKGVTVGSFNINSPYVIVQPEKGYFASPEAVGFVSNNLLSKYNIITIDYINHRLYYSDQP